MPGMRHYRKKIPLIALSGITYLNQITPVQVKCMVNNRFNIAPVNILTYGADNPLSGIYTFGQYNSDVECEEGKICKFYRSETNVWNDDEKLVNMHYSCANINDLLEQTARANLCTPDNFVEVVGWWGNFGVFCVAS